AGAVVSAATTIFSTLFVSLAAVVVCSAAGFALDVAFAGPSANAIPAVSASTDEELANNVNTVRVMLTPPPTLFITACSPSRRFCRGAPSRRALPQAHVPQSEDRRCMGTLHDSLVFSAPNALAVGGRPQPEKRPVCAATDGGFIRRLCLL